MESQLTAILNFYAYLIIAMDSDTFESRGGQALYDQLQQIVQWAQSSGETGWKAFEDTKNRSAVLAALTDQKTSCFRDLLYAYHRRGLDEMATSPDKGRANITASLDNLQKAFDVAPMSVGLSMFKDAKLDELVNVYSKASTEERTKVYEILQNIYPTEQSRLDKIKNPPTKNDRASTYIKLCAYLILGPKFWPGDEHHYRRNRSRQVDNFGRIGPCNGNAK